MKNQKLCKVRSRRHIPSDLYPDILSRLPVKSLLRFRCVAKSWLALVDDADFVRLHLNNFKNNTDETHLLAVHNKQQNCISHTSRLNCMVRRNDTFETIPDALGEYANSCDREWYIVYSVDGLLLLERISGLRRSSDIQVWNPSIRKFLQLPSFHENPDSSLLYSVFGLGFDTTAKDYKLVLLVYADTTAVSSKTHSSVLIYTLGANSWKTVEFQVKEGSTFSQRISTCFWTSPGLYFQGCLYAISCHNKLYVVVFDLNREMFSTIDSPEFHCRARLALVDSGHSLAMFGVEPGENSIWVLQTESMSWTKRYTFQLKCFQVLYLKNNCHILVLRRRCDKIAHEKAGKKKEIRWDQAVVYSPETDEYRNLHEKRYSPSYYHVNSMRGYVESLILHK